MLFTASSANHLFWAGASVSEETFCGWPSMFSWLFSTYWNESLIWFGLFFSVSACNEEFSLQGVPDLQLNLMAAEKTLWLKHFLPFFHLLAASNQTLTPLMLMTEAPQLTGSWSEEVQKMLRDVKFNVRAHTWTSSRSVIKSFRGSDVCLGATTVG